MKSSRSKVVRITTRARCRLGEPPGRLDAVQHRHLHVHQHDVGLQPPDDVDGGRPSPASPTTRRSVLGLEDEPEPGAHELLVVDQDHGDHEARTSPVTTLHRRPRADPHRHRHRRRARAVRRGGDGGGIEAVTRHPRAPVGPAGKTPPCSSTRSRIPRSPLPREAPSAGPVRWSTIGVPRPSSATSRSMPSRSARTFTHAELPGPAWRSTLVSDSWTTRTAARSRSVGSRRQAGDLQRHGHPGAAQLVGQLVEPPEGRRAGRGRRRRARAAGAGPAAARSRPAATRPRSRRGHRPRGPGRGRGCDAPRRPGPPSR